MRILSISMCNFISYHGDHSLDFAVNDAAPVILFIGRNGSGKTSINHAARWCLYGETRRGDKIFTENELINRRALRESEQNPIEMSVELLWEADGHVYQLTRTWKYDPTNSNGKQIKILRIDDGNPETEASVDEYVQRFLAKEISHFFFFDGEVQKEFDEMLENSETAAFIRSQIEKTLSIPVIAEAIEWLQIREKQESVAIIKANKDNEKIVFASKKLEKEEAEILVLREELSKSKEQESRSSRGIEEIEADIKNIAEVAAQQDRLNLLKGVVQTLETGRKDILSQIRDLLGTSCWLPVSQKLDRISGDVQRYLSIRDIQARKEVEVLAKIDLLEKLKKTRHCPICNQPNKSEVDDVEDRIKDLKASLSTPDLEIEQSNLSKDEWLKALSYTNAKWIKVRNLKKEYDEKGAELATASNEMKEISVTLSLHGNPDVEGAMQRIKTLSRDLQSARDKIREYGDKIQERSNSIDRLRAEINKVVGVSPEKQKAYNAYRYLRFIYEQMKERYSHLARAQVEQYASKTFLDIISPAKFTGLRINENYGVNLELQGGQIEPMASQGQSKIGSISLISGLIKTVMENGFIFMDTPYVSLDKEHRHRVNTWAAKSDLQVTLFLHTGEFDRVTDLADYEGKVGKIYRIEMVGEDSRVRLEA